MFLFLYLFLGIDNLCDNTMKIATSKQRQLHL